MRRLLPTLSIVTPGLVPLAWHASPTFGLAALGAMVASHASLAYGTLMPNCQWFGPVATRFHSPTGDEVWLTVDDGPDPDDTPRLLDSTFLLK